MAFDHKQVFDAMACAYRHGVLEKVMYIQGRAMEKALEESGLNLVDILNRVDETGDDTVSLIEKVLDRAGPAVSIIGNDFVMKIVARIMDIEKVRELIINLNKAVILKMLKSQTELSCIAEESCCTPDRSLKGVI